jgi:pimeloyl-ACP methyl ester carboxylesterase
MTAVAQETGSAIRPFSVDVPEETLADLRRRIEATVWPERETVVDALGHRRFALYGTDTGSFGWYRAIDTTTVQNEQRRTRRLTMPVLAIGAQYSTGDTVGAAMKLAADDVQTLVIPGVGHWLAEEAPEELLAALTAFLDPYRDGAAAGPKPRPPHAQNVVESPR